MGSNLMRTVTFADADLVDFLKRNFVFVWHNQSPEVYTERGKQETLTTSQVAAYPEGGGGGNVRTYFCSPEGQVVSYLEGFWRPEAYREEAEAAIALQHQLTKTAAPDRAAAVGARIAARRAELVQRRKVAREEVAARVRKRKAEEIDIVRVEGAFGLRDNSLAESVKLALQPVTPILGELAARNRKHGVVA